MTTDYSLKAAKEAAAKVNAMLVATGQLRPSDLNKGRTKQGKSSDLFVEEVVINDAPMSARNFLTRSSTQEEISKMSGASVSTRGRYMTQEEIEKNASNDRPLYLHIQGVNQQDVKVAVGRIMHLIMEHTHRKGSSHHHKHKGHRPAGPNSGRLSPQIEMNNSAGQDPVLETPVFLQNVLREKVFLPMNVNLNPVEVRLRLVGENNNNIKYIQDETGASIFMRGIGSGFLEASTGMESQEALHFYLEHNNQDQFNQAKDLVVNLAQTILTQIHQEQSQEHIPPPQSTTQSGFQQSHPSQIAINGSGVLPPQPVIPPQIHTSNQVIVSAVGPQVPPGVLPPQLNMNPLQLPHGASPLLMTQQLPTPNNVSSQPMQEPPPPHMAPGTQLVQISVPSAVTTPNLVSQQFVQTSVGPQLVQLPLPHGTQLVSTPDGPRIVSLAPATTASTGFITQSVYTSSTIPDSHGSVGMSLPQPVPQPMPPISSTGSFGQGEAYLYETEQSKFPTSTPVLMTPTSTFAYLPPAHLEQDHVTPATIALEVSQAQWPPSSNPIFSHVSIPSTQEVSLLQGSQTQVTFTHPPITHPTDTFQTASVSSFSQAPASVSGDHRRPHNSEWNMESMSRPPNSINHFSQNCNPPTTDHLRETSVLTKDPRPNSDPSRCSTDQSRSPTKGVPYMWAQYPHGDSDPTLTVGPPYPRGCQLATAAGMTDKEPMMCSIYNRDDGGTQQDERIIAKNPAELYSKDLAPQGPRHAPRKTPSSGGFSAESKRRRSFKPKGEFRGMIRGLKREHVPMRDTSSLRPPLEDFSSSSGADVDFHGRPLRQEELHSRVPGGGPGVPPFMSAPPLDKGVNPWAWNQNEGAQLLPASAPQMNMSFVPRSKLYESPWESGIPGVPAGRDLLRPSEPFHRSKIGNRRF